MEHQLSWANEEEGTITFFEGENFFLTVQFFATGEEETEFKLQDIVFPEDYAENDKIREKVILKMTRCISECFLLLWNEGFEDVILVEQNGTKIAEILNSTPVVRLVYSEYMMKRRIEPQKSTNCGPATLVLKEEEDGYCCENTDNTFFCRLLPYPAEQPGEDCFYLYEVGVSKRKRNKGIATACLKELFCRLANAAPVTIYLQVGSYNEPAVHLYEKLGFEVSEELRYYAIKE